MTKIQLKATRRKTQVSRAKVRSIMSQLFAQTPAVVIKKNAAKRSLRKVVTGKAIARKAVSHKAA